MKLLLDTNVVSEWRKPSCDTNVFAWFQQTDDLDLAISVITVGEIVRGISRLPDGKRRRELQIWFDTFESYFASHTIDLDRETAKIWGRLSGLAADKGKPLAVADGLIAATAIHLRFQLIKRNTADFEVTGVPVLNPWIG